MSTEATSQQCRHPIRQYQGESVTYIPLAELHPFPDQPFKVREDKAMQETVESVREYGALTPTIVRPRESGGYEIVSGHRRKHAYELAGADALPAIVRNLDDDAAIILLVNSNIQREEILPSERAQALKMKLDAIKRQGARTDLTSRKLHRSYQQRRLAQKLESVEIKCAAMFTLLNCLPSYKKWWTKSSFRLTRQSNYPT